MIYGQSGDDILYSKDGGDMLYGGSGSDMFIIYNTAANGFTTIMDFWNDPGNQLLLNDTVNCYRLWSELTWLTPALLEQEGCSSNSPN